jgi:hypothetical protein
MHIDHYLILYLNPLKGINFIIKNMKLLNIVLNFGFQNTNLAFTSLNICFELF